MRRTYLVLATIAAVLAAAAGAGFGQSSATPTLQGTVGPGFTITLKKNGTKVKVLKAGRYRFAVSDKASIHNFTLERETGGKFEKDLTDVSFTGTKSVMVTTARLTNRSCSGSSR